MYALCKDRLDALGGAHLRATRGKLRIPRTMIAAAAEIFATQGAGVKFTQPVPLKRIMLLTMLCLRHSLDLRSVTTDDLTTALLPTTTARTDQLFRAFKDIGRVGQRIGTEADYGWVMTHEAIPVAWYNPLHRD